MLVQERAEGTATPPWYEKLNDAENRQEVGKCFQFLGDPVPAWQVKQEIRRKESHGAIQAF